MDGAVEKIIRNQQSSVIQRNDVDMSKVKKLFPLSVRIIEQSKTNFTALNIKWNILVTVLKEDNISFAFYGSDFEEC